MAGPEVTTLSQAGSVLSVEPLSTLIQVPGVSPLEAAVSVGLCFRPPLDREEGPAPTAGASPGRRQEAGGRRQGEPRAAGRVRAQSRAAAGSALPRELRRVHRPGGKPQTNKRHDG